MTKILLLIVSLLVFCFLPSSLLSQDKYFDRSYDFEHTDQINAITKVKNNYIVAANVVDAINGDNSWDLLYVKFNNYGDTIKMVHIENTTDTACRGILSNKGKTFIIGTESGISNIHPYSVGQLNIFNNDNLENTFIYQDSLEAVSIFRDITKLTESKIIMGGRKFPDYIVNANFVYFTCIDTTGTLLWDTIYTQYENSQIFDISKTSEDGNFYAVGRVNYVNLPAVINDVSDGLLLKIDSTGIIIWGHIIDFEQADQLVNCLSTSDGGVLVSYSKFNSDRKLMKFDAMGSTEWISDVLFEDGGTVRLIKSQDENYLLASSSYGSSDELMGRVLKVDTLGNVLWNRWYGGLEDDDYFYDMIQEEDGSLVMCGRKESGVAQGADLWLVKTNCMGLMTEPQAEFTYEQNDSLTFAFENLSEFVYPDSIDGGHYLWDFGDGTLSTEESPTHTYSENSTYEVNLTAVVCQDTAIYTACLYLDENTLCCADVEELPVVAFSDTPIGDSLTIAFTNQSQNLYEDYSNGASFFWDFGDGNNSSEVSTVHSYVNAGVYDVSLSLLFCNDTSVLEYSLLVGDTTQTAISNPALFSNVQVYPNPSSGAVVFSFAPQVQESVLRLYDAKGQMVKQVRLARMSESKALFLGNLPKGIYFYQLGGANGKIVLK